MKFNRLALLSLALFGQSLSNQSFAANDPTALAASVQQSANASANFQCLDLRKAAQKLPVYASNIANRDVSRTPEGGPYKRIELICKQMYCEQVAKDDFKFIYLPGNPDANPNGMVRRPVISVPTEYAALTSAAAEVRLLATTGACGASSLSSPTVAMIKYDAGSSLQSDTFNYSNDGRLSSWSRTLRDGTSQHFAFAADGTTLAQ